MSVHQKLVTFVEAKIKDLNKEVGGPLNADTSLIRSGLFDSLALLNLAAWIEKEVGSPMDMTAIDPLKEWDTVDDIVNFIERHKK